MPTPTSLVWLLGHVVLGESLISGTERGVVLGRGMSGALGLLPMHPKCHSPLIRKAYLE